ncbi:Uncharacterized protein TCM_022640 [Theobroma cacao]|uniref:Reverse transcriptase n=1 Tax=Theobroma cacao TaxID=3641 RepID=A0A061EV65_THECC|nr:Uncharacterized protein TCM_022640 [Theobroma cacao]
MMGGFGRTFSIKGYSSDTFIPRHTFHLTSHLYPILVGFPDPRVTTDRGFLHFADDLQRIHHFSIMVLLEQRVSGTIADKVIRSVKFDRSHRVEVIGFLEGIQVLWIEHLQILIIRNHDQCIHLNVRDGFGESWLLIAVYGHLDHKTKRALWAELSSFAKHVTCPWLLSRDFNAFLYAHEKVGGSSQGSKFCLYFQRLISAYGLIDLGFKGSKYTWKRGLVSERIDWAICNTDWRLKFHEATVQHLPRVKSDHRPLLISLEARGVTDQSLRFQFQAAWLSHSKFSDFVKQNWDSSSDIQGALKKFSDSAHVWNREVFGNIFSEKKRILARLLGIEKELETRQSRYLQELEVKLPSVDQIEIINGMLGDFWACSGEKTHGGKRFGFEKVTIDEQCLLDETVMATGDSNQDPLGDGLSTQFWKDIWLEDTSFFEQGHVLSIVLSENCCVREFLLDIGEWDREKLAAYLLGDLVNKILMVLPPSLSLKPDTPYWAPSASGVFTVVSTYELLRKDYPNYLGQQSRKWAIAWKWDGP